MRLGLRLLALLVFASVLAVGGTQPPRAAPQGPLRPAPGLRLIDVGQGSALLVIGDGAAVLLDSGPSGAAEAILAAIELHRIEAIDLWVHTHFDADHLGGATRVLAGRDGVAGTDDDLEVGEFWDRGFDDVPSTATFAAYAAAVEGRRRAVVSGERWTRGGISVEVVAGPAAAGGENERGIALRIDVMGVTVLAPGDLPPSALGELARAPVDILWASHHGARDATTPDLLAALDPRLVVVTAGLDNPYCHPSARVVAWLGARPAWFTGAAGLAPDGPCEPLASHLGEAHAVVGGDLWIAADAR